MNTPRCLASSTILAAHLAATFAYGGQPCADFNQADNAVRALLANHPELAGAAIIVADRDGTIHQAFFGDYNESTVIPVASASKLLSGVAIMTLIDRGLLDPDAPVSDSLPEDFSVDNAGPLKPTMTVRQMFAHISGLPGEDATSAVLANRTITLEQSVQRIACCTPIEDLPGDSFAYGGLSMQVAGRVAEVVSGQDWESFFVSTLSTPLGLTSIDYQGLGPTTNPRIAGGAQSNLRDYARILQTLLRAGEIDGVRVLSQQGVADMLVDQAAGLPVRFTPPGSEGWGYAFGGWVSRTDAQGNTTEFTSPGAFGFTPWIDLERDVVGIIMVEGFRQTIADELNGIKAAIELTLDDCAGVCRADLAEPFGTLNFFDIAAYIDAFNTGDPSADLAPPFGRTNFFDMAAYIARFDAGCP